MQLQLNHRRLTSAAVSTGHGFEGSKHLWKLENITNTIHLHYNNYTTRNRCGLLRCKASQEKETNNSTTKNNKNALLSPEQIATIDTPLLRIWLPLAVFLGILMLIDAAYSGDWSRIGAITKEQELQLQSVAVIAVGGHAACAVVAGTISKQRGESSWVLRGVKTLAAGFVGLVEVILLPDPKDEEK